MCYTTRLPRLPTPNPGLHTAPNRHGSKSFRPSPLPPHEPSRPRGYHLSLSLPPFRNSNNLEFAAINKTQTVGTRA